ncbi:Ankyrin repeat-containing domain protein [Niveomyces insectorum RCEF 264]|uniref:Ankyrin repeat-containing domain protein n=1 Tax=Niveomyces insectorum RCEF 264 TaxID=1081102 RepID=A0A167QSI4_9HYPO|nr:Ankyrin repeat-containing domain protein [Niveomyces insectorum RCEF 264]
MRPSEKTIGIAPDSGSTAKEEEHSLPGEGAPRTGLGLVVEGEAQEEADLDVIAIHGVHDAVKNPWRDSKDGQSVFQKAFEDWTERKVRLMTYNYAPGPLTPWTFHNEAYLMLKDLQALRVGVDGSGTDDSEKLPRPIIFVSHDLGGLIVKSAMTQATSTSRTFAGIASSVRGLRSDEMFVACPHRHDGVRSLQDQLADLLHDYGTARLPTGPLAQSVAKTVERINGDFIHSKILISAICMNIFSTKSDPTSQIFSEYTATLDTPFERRVGCDHPHRQLAASLLDSDDEPYTTVLSIARWVWSIEPHKQKTMELLQTLLSIAPPVYPLLGCPSMAHWDVFTQHHDLGDFVKAKESRVLHVRCVSDAYASLLGKSLVRHITKNAAPHKVVLYYEFRRGEGSFNNVRSMLATWMAQLFCNEVYERPLYAQNILGMPDEYRGWTAVDLLVMWRRYRLTKEFNKAIYVLNGLDHCDESVQMFLSCLGFIVAETELPIKIAITTTAETDSSIRTALDVCPGDKLRRLDVAIGDVPRPTVSSQDDVLQLDRLIQDHARLGALEPRLAHLWTGSAETNDLEHIVARWLQSTHLALHDIAAALNSMTSVSPEPILKGILGRIPAKRLPWSRRLLSFVSASLRPLQVAEFCAVSQIALALSEEPGLPSPCYQQDILDDIWKWLGGFLIIQNGEVHFSHVLLRGALRSPPFGHENQQHRDIFEVCIAYLGHPRNHTLPPSSQDAMQQEAAFGLRDIWDALPYAVEHWSRHYQKLVAAGSKLPRPIKDEINRQVLHLVKDNAFLDYWGRAYSDILGPFDPIFGPYGRPTSLSVAAQLGLHDAVAALTAVSSPEHSAGLVAAARYGHLSVVRLLLEPTGKNARFGWRSLGEAATAAAKCGHNDVFRLLVKQMSRALDARPPVVPPATLLFRAAWLGLDDVVTMLLDLGADPDTQASVNLYTPLHSATVLDRSAVLKVLLSRGGDSTGRASFSSYWPLHVACNYGSRKCIGLLLDTKHYPDDPGENSSVAPLVLAVEEGNFEVAELLLKHDRLHGRVSKDGVSMEYANAVQKAVDMDYRRCVKVLLDYGADPKLLHSSDENVLQRAIVNENYEICSLLLGNGADVNDRTGGYASIVIAATQNNHAIVSLLLEHGALVNATNESSGRTALHVAALSGRDDIVKTLLDAKANIEARDGAGYTPVSMAANNGSESTVRILAEAGADLTAAVTDGKWSPLHLAYRHPAVARVLLKHGANVNQPSTYGTPLQLAARTNEVEVVKLLLEKDANLLDTNSEGDTPFAHAVRSGDWDVVEALLEGGDDINQRILETYAMEYAVAEDSSTMVERLLEFSPDLTLKNTRGNTFLHCIQRVTPVRSVQRLVRAGADPNAENATGHTPLCGAIVVCNDEAVRYLFQLKSIKRSGISGHPPGDGSFLYHAAAFGTTEMVKLFVEAGEDVHDIETLDGGLIAAACRHRVDDESLDDRLEKIRYLCHETDADVRAKGGALSYAICMAAAVCEPEVIRLLTSAGATVDVTDAYGRTPVHLACHNTLATMQALRMPDETFARRDSFDRLPLHHAALGGRVDLVKDVVARSRRLGIGIDDTDQNGWTPLMWAARVVGAWPRSNAQADGNHEDVLKYLLSEGASLSVSGDGEGGKWTPAEIAAYHGASPSLVSLLTPSDAKLQRSVGPRLRVGALETRFCDACLVFICGLHYRYKDMDLCLTCSLFKEKLQPNKTWVRQGQDTLFEDTSDGAGSVSDPGADGHTSRVPSDNGDGGDDDDDDDKRDDSDHDEHSGGSHAAYDSEGFVESDGDALSDIGSPEAIFEAGNE